MTKQDIAQSLVELWGEYLSKTTRTFQPTMTDFIDWLRKTQIPGSEQFVKSHRTPPNSDEPVGEEQNPVVQLSDKSFKSDGLNEVSVAQPSRDATISAADKKRIRDLYKQGYSAARVRHILGLKVTIGTIYSIANKK